MLCTLFATFVLFELDKTIVSWEIKRVVIADSVAKVIKTEIAKVCELFCRLLSVIQCHVFRGHTVKAVTESFKMSKDAGFKVVTHMMPDLPNVGLERDIEQFIVRFVSHDVMLLIGCWCLSVSLFRLYSWGCRFDLACLIICCSIFSYWKSVNVAYT